jgi:putative ABC transport system permease protein
MLKLVFRNVFRHRTRSVVTLATIVVGVVSVILSAGFVQDIFYQLGEAVIHSQTGHLQLARSGYFEHGTRNPEQYVIDNPRILSARVQSLPGVAQAMARLNFSGLLNNGQSDVPIVAEGIEPGPEAQAGTYLKIRTGRQLRPSDRFGMLIGEGLAQALRASPGERLTLLVSTAEGAMNVLDFEVVGVFATYSKDYDARTVKIPLSAAQELLNANVANTIVVVLDRTDDTDHVAEIARELVSGNGLEVRKWQSLNDFYDKTVKLYERQLGVLRLIVLLMVLIAVASVVNMTVHERIGEVGTMRALGNRGSDVFVTLVAENTLLGVMGAALGVVLAIAAAQAISAIGIPMPPPPNANLGYTAQIRIELRGVLIAFLIGLIAATGASVLPAFRVSRYPIIDALRENI